MGELQNFVRDDENDTLLFERLQEHVLEHYPNPDRVGCFDRATLITFVETPGRLDLEDPKYLHVFRCAECTRDLMELRRLREERIRQAATRSAQRTPRWWWYAGVAAAVTIVAVLVGVSRTHDRRQPVETAQAGVAVPVSVDLSSDGLARDGAKSDAPAPIPLPRRVIELRLVLPYYSPAGSYRVTVSRDQSESLIEASDSAQATVEGSHTELRVRLDLGHLTPGNHYLGTTRVGDGAPYYYPVVIR
ncbi:hypothetical protein HNQ77_002354 [Silvibacterium bohemicum]|uniref:Uncharacterized protein n=1 Tax=Silvibacterium bohemicum TaxID=1577686 RepID=A0A841JSL7_9BACT|nr:hypothetical protein [Silvibacterium bohemicum]MBB6144402.1 hypothetical protein [Silvibacterium bohemicum]